MKFMELQVGVKIILQNTEGKYLMLLRSAIKYPEAGAKWEIAGGRINPGTSLLENLKREVIEETGLEVKGEPKLITCPQCANQSPYEWNTRGMTRCVSCHLLFENPETEGK